MPGTEGWPADAAHVANGQLPPAAAEDVQLQLGLLHH